MRAAFAAVSALLLSALALPAAAQEAPMSAEQIRELARRDTVWCENYRAAQQDCETITLVSLLPDGSLRETGLMRLSGTPDLKLVVDGRSQITGDRVCSVFGDDTVKLNFLLNGRPAPQAMVGLLEGVVKEAMAEFEGKTFCQTFYRLSEAEVREVITVDGDRREDLESRYRLQADEAGLDVRPAEEEAEAQPV